MRLLLELGTLSRSSPDFGQYFDSLITHVDPLFITPGLSDLRAIVHAPVHPASSKPACKVLQRGKDGILHAVNEEEQPKEPSFDFLSLVAKGLEMGLTAMVTKLIQVTTEKMRAPEHAGTVIPQPEAVQCLSALADTLRDSTDSALQETTTKLMECLLVQLVKQVDTPSPVRPTDWSKRPSNGCRCRLCITLNRFLKDPQEQTGRFCATKANRDYLLKNLPHREFYITDTEKVDSSYTLVIQKTHLDYYSAVDSWAALVEKLVHELTPLNTDVIEQILGFERFQSLVLLRPLLTKLTAERAHAEQLRATLAPPQPQPSLPRQVGTSTWLEQQVQAQIGEKRAAKRPCPSLNPDLPPQHA